VPLVSALLKNDREIQIIKETMATKTDINRIMDHIDSAIKKIDVFSKKELVQDYRLINLEETVHNHEARLVGLETR